MMKPSIVQQKDRFFQLRSHESLLVQNMCEGRDLRKIFVSHLKECVEYFRNRFDMTDKEFQL